MLRYIDLVNFQSHEETHIDFVSGINAIIGKSNSGKTAILRGFDLVFRNRPVGIGYVSYWNRDKKGNPKDPTYVGLGLDNNWEITRNRERDFNGYRINQDGILVLELGAVDSDVPQEIHDRLNMTDVNYQRQLDSHFLLSSTNGEVARFFNKIIRLDMIDRILSASESKRKYYKQEIEKKKQLVVDYEAQLVGFAWIDEADSLLIKATRVNTRIEEKTKQRDSLNQQICAINSAQGIIQTLKFIPQAEQILHEFDALNEVIEGKTTKQNRLKRQINELKTAQGIIQGNKFIPAAEQILHEFDKVNGVISEKEKTAKRLQQFISEYRKQQKILDELPDTKAPLALISEIDALTDLIKQKRTVQKELSIAINNLKFHTKVIADSIPEIEKLESQLPDTCPICGGPMKGGDKCVQS